MSDGRIYSELSKKMHPKWHKEHEETMGDIANHTESSKIEEALDRLGNLDKYLLEHYEYNNKNYLSGGIDESNFSRIDTLLKNLSSRCLEIKSILKGSE